MKARRELSAFQEAWRPLVAAAFAILALFPAGCGSTRDGALPARFLKQYNLQGRVVLVEFGMIDCALSDEGLDKMIRLHRAKEIEDLAYIRVETVKDEKAVDRYYAAKSPGFPVYRDPDSSLARALDATVSPSFVLVDKFGHVRYRGPFPDARKLANWADTLLAEEADPGPEAPQFGVVKLASQKLLDETRLPDLKGTVKPLREYLGPRGLVAVFVDTTCPFSGSAITDMAAISATLAKHGVPSLLVNLGDPKETVLGFYTKRDTGTPVLYDVTRDTQKKWQVDAVPTVMLLGADGNMAYRGKAVWASLSAAVEKELKLAAGSVAFDIKGTEFG